MLHSDRVAIAAHLHVLLRRRTGRVTDTEWMATNAEYAQAMIRFARQHAVEDNAPELDEWAGRLERAWATPLEQQRQSFLDAAVRTVSMRVGSDGTQVFDPQHAAPQAQPGPAPGAPGAPRPPAGPAPNAPAGGSRYVGRLR